MYTDDTHHFPAYGVAPDYWAQRALGTNHGQPLALAPFATERLLACENLLREREQATTHAERRNANREKQLQDHTVKLDEHRAQLEAAHASLLSQQAAQKAKAAELKRWEASLLQREENLKSLLLSSPQGRHGGQSGETSLETSLDASLDRRLDARAAADGARSPQPPPQQQRPPPQRTTPAQAQAHEQRSRLQSLKYRGPPPQVAADGASPFLVRPPRAVATDMEAPESTPPQDPASASQEATAAEEAMVMAAARRSREAEERARVAAASQVGVGQADVAVEGPPPAHPAAASEGRPRSRQLPQARASYAAEGEGAGPADEVGMVRCAQCGRSFAEDRIDAHERACQAQSAAKPRQVFDVAKGRRAHIVEAGGVEQGEGAEVGRPQKARLSARPPKERAGDGGEHKWKSESENLRAVMKYNRELAAAQKAGRDISTLPPPPKQLHDDRVACPHCDRKFKTDVAERHIPKCNSRPK